MIRTTAASVSALRESDALVPAPVSPAARTFGASGRSLPQRLKVVFWVFALWTALGLFFASQIIVLGDEVTWRQALRLAMPRWYTWGLLAPAVGASDRWFGAGRSLRARLAMHLPLGIAWTLIGLTIRLMVRPLVGNPWPPSLLTFVLQRFYWDLLIYAVIAGVSVARDYAAQVREQERRTLELQLQSVELHRHLAEARLQSLRSQLQPHFLFNALNTISALTETDPKSARRLMEQLGHLLRVSLRHASTPFVTLAEELTFLDDYLTIERVRFEGRITVSVHADDDTLDAVVPSFLLQPLVENAIRHGVGPRLAGGRIAVTAAREGAVLRLTVRDDGVGLAADWGGRRDAGVGLRNTAARLEQLYPEGHVFRVMPGAAAGVEVLLDLPWRSAPAASKSFPVGAAAPHGASARQ
jgi:signal transduction histidine kinase